MAACPHWRPSCSAARSLSSSRPEALLRRSLPRRRLRRFQSSLRLARTLVVGSEPIYAGLRAQIVALVTRHAIPAVFTLSEFVAAGGLITYGASLVEAYRQAGIYTGKILNGAKPADMPV
jgi:hypothetical protein